MDIKVLGTGCANCKNTLALIERTAKELGVDINLTKVEAVEDIMKYGVAATPAVVINEVVVHSGGIPSAEKVRAWLSLEDKTASTCCSGSNCSSAQPAPVSSCATGNCGSNTDGKRGMGVSSMINLMAGSMVLLGLVLAHLSGTVDMLSPSWLWLPAFVGLNLVQFAFTGFCPAKKLFEKLGAKPSCC